MGGTFYRHIFVDKYDVGDFSGTVWCLLIFIYITFDSFVTYCVVVLFFFWTSKRKQLCFYNNFCRYAIFLFSLQVNLTFLLFCNSSKRCTTKSFARSRRIFMLLVRIPSWHLLPCNNNTTELNFHTILLGNSV